MISTRPKQFSKDHWSLLAYVETRAVDHRNRLDHEHMRTNIGTHPFLRNDAYQKSRPKRWESSHSTRLRGNKTIDGHDDWDCLDDLDDAGLVEIISLVNGFVRMTDYGLAISAQLRKHKANGGKYRDFDPFDRKTDGI